MVYLKDLVYFIRGTTRKDTKMQIVYEFNYIMLHNYASY